jgi:hypothetical protein
MSSPTIEKIIEEARHLNPEQRQELSRRFGELVSAAPSRTAEQQLDEALIRAGVMVAPPLRSMTQEEYDAWEPVEIEGKLLSETIIEERR